MSKVLVAYFSASGMTADAAKKIAEITGAELYEIRPEVPYTQADLNWRDQSSRLKNSMNGRAAIEEGIVVHGKQDSDTWKTWIASLGM